MRVGIILILFISFPLALQAEYRVFLLRLGPKDSDKFKTFKSTLDPLQYPFYYQVPKDFVVEYTDTWMCKGTTAHFQPLCDKPVEGPNTTQTLQN